MDSRPRTISFSLAPKKSKMSLSQTYYVAASARSKLGKEAARPDHNLRRLVGHANLLDNLMVELQDAEREQERWFNQTVTKAQQQKSERKSTTIQWADTIVEEEDSDSSDDEDSDDEYTEEDYMMSAAPTKSIRVPAILPTHTDEDSDEEEDDYYFDDDEDLPELALVRTASNAQSTPPSSPPELVHDSDSEDETSPPNSPPPQLTMNFPIVDKKQRVALQTAPLIAALA